MNKRKKLVLALSFTLSIPCIFFSSKSEIKNNSFNKKIYINSYKHIRHVPDNSLNSIKSYSDEIKKRLTSQELNYQRASDSYIKKIEEVVSDNFIHHDLLYRSQDHWLGYLLAKTGLPKIKNILFVLKPEHIALAKHAMCSQQAILVQEILKHDGHNYASIGFYSPTFGHFATAAFIEGKSYYLDTNMSPGHINDGEIIPKLLTKNSSEVKRLYSPWTNESYIKTSIKNFSSYPARNGLIIQNFIFFLE